MSEIYQRIVALTSVNDVRISDHGFRELENVDIIIGDLVRSLKSGELVENYPDFHKGPSVLILSYIDDQPVPSVWGLVNGQTQPAWLITAYRPELKKWFPDWKTRREK